MHPDPLTTFREVTDSTAAVRARYDYDLYGRRTKLGGDLEADFGYTGHYYHAPSKLHLAFYRAYDAELGRWLNRDPLGEAGGLNLYGYVLNDPVNAIDPFGLDLTPLDAMAKQLIEQLKAIDRRLREMIEGLERSSHSHTVQCKNTGANDELWRGVTISDSANLEEALNEVNGVGTGSVIETLRNPVVRSDGATITPLDNLAHELQHAADLDKGIINRSANPNTGTPISEERAVRNQNIVREHLKMQLLDTYGSKKSGGTPVEHFRP